MKQLTIITKSESQVFDLPDEFFTVTHEDSNGKTSVIYFKEGVLPSLDNADRRNEALRAPVIAKVNSDMTFVVTEKKRTFLGLRW